MKINSQLHMYIKTNIHWRTDSDSIKCLHHNVWKCSKFKLLGPLWHHKMSYFICHHCCIVLCHCVENTMSEPMLLYCSNLDCGWIVVSNNSVSISDNSTPISLQKTSVFESYSSGRCVSRRGMHREWVWAERQRGDRKHCSYHSSTDGAADEMGVEDGQIRRDSKRGVRYGKRTCETVYLKNGGLKLHGNCFNQHRLIGKKCL